MLNRLSVFVARITKLPEQFIRFLFVGCLNTAFSYSLYAFCVFIGFHYALAVFCSTAIGICFSFKTFGKLVFDNPDNRLIFKFLLVYAFGYLLNVGILRVLTGIGLENLYIDGIISSGLVACVSFFLNKFFVFKKKALQKN